MAASMALLERAESAEPEEQATPARSHTVQPAATSTVKHYKADDSIFIDDAYLIKGIAGRIFWKLVQSYAQSGRVDFTNKEIRLDASLQLPDFKDNLEARLILLRRRLQDRCGFVSLYKLGEGSSAWKYSGNSRWKSIHRGPMRSLRRWRAQPRLLAATPSMRRPVDVNR